MNIVEEQLEKTLQKYLQQYNDLELGRKDLIQELAAAIGKHCTHRQILSIIADIHRHSRTETPRPPWFTSTQCVNFLGDDGLGDC